MTWSLSHYNEKYAINPQADKLCILIPGWGVASDIFEWMLPALAQDFIVYQADIKSYDTMTTAADAATQLQAQMQADILPEHLQKDCYVMGWSLGGNIALQLALDFPGMVDKLILLATSPSFIARDHWPHAMDEKTYGLFHKGITANSDKTLKRFDMLQAKGDAQQKDLSHALSEYRKQQQRLSDEELSAGLSLLADFDQVCRLPELQQSVFWCLGENDALVNAAIAQELKRLLPAADIEVLTNTSHLPFLSASDAVFLGINALIKTSDLSKKIQRQKVAASFSRAATSYDDAADVQKIVAEKLMAYLPKQNDMKVLDAGCGTGYWTRRIAKNVAQITGLDLAHGMLSYAQQHSDSTNITFCGGDLERLPLADNSVDAVFSSLAVQWCDSISPLLEEWHRVLKPGGQICLATLGPKTLYELRESFQQVDDDKHVNQFLAQSQLEQQIEQSPMQLLVIHNELQVMPYQRMRDLMRDLKSIGAQTVLNQQQDASTSSSGLMGKAHFNRANKAYESFRQADGFLPASYEVIYLHLVK